MRYSLRIRLPICLRASRNSSRPTRRRSCSTSGATRLWTICNGIGIYAPFITDKGILKRLELSDSTNGTMAFPLGREDYEKLDIFKTSAKPGGPAQSGAKPPKTTWPVLVYDVLKRTIPAGLMVDIDGIGELQTGDRADVAQVIMSIESVLNRLDRSVARAKDDILAPLREPTIEGSRSIAASGDVITLGLRRRSVRLARSGATGRHCDVARSRRIAQAPEDAIWLALPAGSTGYQRGCPDVVDIAGQIAPGKSHRRSARPNA